MDYALDLKIRVVRSSPGMDYNFSFYNSRFSLLAAESAHANEITRDIHELIPCF